MLKCWFYFHICCFLIYWHRTDCLWRCWVHFCFVFDDQVGFKWCVSRGVLRFGRSTPGLQLYIIIYRKTLSRNKNMGLSVSNCGTIEALQSKWIIKGKLPIWDRKSWIVNIRVWSLQLAKFRINKARMNCSVLHNATRGFVPGGCQNLGPKKIILFSWIKIHLIFSHFQCYKWLC